MIIQVNKIVRQRKLFSNFFRYVQHESLSTGGVLYPLQNRKLLKVYGEDASVFLQGLITNDMRHLEDHKSMYGMFLNNKGRVLFDTLIHKWEGEDSFLLETDKKTVDLLHKHLKIYKLRRQVNIEDISNNLSIWALESPNVKAVDLEIDPKRELNVYKDPRIVDLGFRIVTASAMTGNDVSTALGKDIKLEDSEDKYRSLRYRLGVSEGPDDLPPGTSFPLEANCDYLHGVSFHKGCYIGQEVTARVHHTGVVRKRMMPLKFATAVEDNIEKDSVISSINKPKGNFGKFKSVLGEYGLGLMRVKEATEEKELIVGNHKLVAFKPFWWPLEAPKEKVFSSKSETE